MSTMDKLAEFLESKDLRFTFQPDRNFTNPKLLRKYIKDLEDAVEHYSELFLDEALGLYKMHKYKEKLNEPDNSN